MEVAALRSQLMVLATGCRQDDRYNAFVRKYQADLMGNEKAVGELFKRKYRQARAAGTRPLHHRPGQRRIISAGMRLGSDFCDRNGLIFTEVMALRSAGELPAYAAGKDLVPATLECARPPPAGAAEADHAPVSCRRSCQAGHTARSRRVAGYQLAR